jgi:hypothetical protein
LDNLAHIWRIALLVPMGKQQAVEMPDLQTHRVGSGQLPRNVQVERPAVVYTNPPHMQ